MLFHARTADEMASRVREVEAEISGLRCEKAVLVNELDMYPQHVSGLVLAARRLAKYRPVNFRLAEGLISVDCAVILIRLAEAGADESTRDAAEASLFYVAAPPVDLPAGYGHR